jgi:hypothetical protein
VWLAQQSGPAGLERLVAIKRMLGEEEAEATQLFIDEARLAAQLTHPNIVHMHELAKEDGTWFLSMEYLAGETLSRLLKAAHAEGGLPIELLVHIVARAAEGLGYAHECVGHDGAPLHIVHRDVSPQNVFITWDGHVKLLDFGIARAAGRASRTASGVVRGKLAYMSPEQAEAQAVDARADVFSLGVVLWEGLARQRLYGERGDLEILKRLLIEGEPAALLSSVRPEVPHSLEGLVSRALALDRRHRPPNGRALQLALDTWLREHGQVPTSADLGAVLQRLFAERMAASKRVVEDAATKSSPALATPFVAREAPTQTSSPALLPAPPARRRARWPTVVVAASSFILAGMALKYAGAQFTLSAPEVVTVDAGVPVQLAPALLRDYVGTYEMAPGFDVFVTTDGRQLTAQATGQDPFALAAFSPTTFASASEQIALEFRRDAGVVVDLVVMQKGQRYVCPRTSNTVSPPVLPAIVEVSREVLASYVGTFQVRPGVALAVSVDGGQLLTQLADEPVLEAFAESDTHFFVPGNFQLDFQRGPKGVVDSVIVHGSGRHEIALRRR